MIIRYNIRGSQDSVPILEVNIDTVYRRSNIHRITVGDAEMWEYDEIEMTMVEYLRDSYPNNPESFWNALNIAFVTLSQNGTIDEVTAAEHSDLFSEWKDNIGYKIGDICRHEENLYKCLQAHTSQSGWEPDAAVSLWKKIGDPTVEYPEWSQPVGASDAYQLGDKVSHNNKHWVSTANNNVWEPGVYGWSEVS